MSRSALGRVVPPLVSPLLGLHFTHRLLGIVAAFVLIAGTLAVLRAGARGRIALLAASGTALVLVQIGLGVWSVAGRLAVTPVSLHTLVAALLFATAAAQARLGRIGENRMRGAIAPLWPPARARSADSGVGDPLHGTGWPRGRARARERGA